MKTVTSYLLLLAGSFLVHSSFAAAGDANLRTESPEDFAVAPSVVRGTVVADKTKYSNFIVGLLCSGAKEPYCAGTYIGHNLVLTAGQCVQASKCRAISVEGNRFNWSDPTEQGIKMNVTSIRVHSMYSDDPLKHDIAIIKVSGGPQLTTYPEIDGGSFSNIAVRKDFKLIGWGQNYWPRYTQSVLREATVRQVPLSECRYLLFDDKSPQGEWYYVQNQMICTDGLYTGTGFCVGDEGGPLFVDSPVPVVVGIISAQYTDCNVGFPNLFTRVASYRGFFDMVAGCRKDGKRFSAGRCV